MQHLRFARGRDEHGDQSGSQLAMMPSPFDFPSLYLLPPIVDALSDLPSFLLMAYPGSSLHQNLHHNCKAGTLVAVGVDGSMLLYNVTLPSSNKTPSKSKRKGRQSPPPGSIASIELSATAKTDFAKEASSFSLSQIFSLIHSFIHSLTHSLTHSHIHIHSLNIYIYIYVDK